MVDYCKSNGFEEINTIIAKFTPAWEREDQ
jgi:hypothetical protein